MQPNMLRLSAIGLALLSLDAGAVGFGEITLQSRVGEALRAEVAIVGDDAAGIGTACFSLAPLRDSDLPVITGARTRLVKVGDGYRLIISGNKPIADPAFVLALRANCGVELQRDFVLMPQPPLSLAEFDPIQRPVAAPSAAAPRAAGQAWRASEGDSLESIAESLVPDDPVKQHRMLAALKRANPLVEADMPLTEGSSVRIPELRKKPAPAPEARPRRAPAPQVARSAAPAPAAVPRAPAPPAATGDRLVLGTPPSDLKPGEQASPLKKEMPEVEQRILKMETTLHALNDQVDKLNEALTLASETLVIQQKLQMAQAMQSAPQVPAPLAQAPAPVAQPTSPQSGSWLELVVSALVGGGFASFVAHTMAKRRQRTMQEQLAPITVAVPPPAAPTAPGSSVKPEYLDPWKTNPTTPIAPPPTADDIDLLLDDSPAPPAASTASGHAPPDSEGVTVDESESALQLAEIMLSFGRLRGAADTLAAYIEERAPDRIEPWLMLLNLYRRGNMRPEFEGLMERIRHRFNFRVPDWEHSQTPISGLKSLEDYAHIAQRLAKSWGTQSAMDYLLSLVHDNRAGQRAGFPLEVVEEIAMLMRLLEDGYGCHRPDQDSPLKAA